MQKIANIAKNTSYLTLALIMQKIISFVYFTLLARELGPENLGSYYFAISFTTIFAIIIDLGLINLLTRETAKRQGEAGKLIGGVIAMKIPLALISVIAVFSSIYGMDYSPQIRLLVYISMISMVLDSFSTTFFSSLRGFHNLKFESIAAILFQVVLMVLGLTALYSGMGLVYLMLALSTASIVNFFFSYFALRHFTGIRIKINLERSYTLDFFKIALPFGIFAIFQRVYVYLDSVFLSIFAGDYYVGLYQVAFKLVFALQFVPMAFTASLYPAMSAYWQDNREQLVVSFERALNYLTIISLPIIAGVLFLADKIILIFRDGYTDAVTPLRVIIIAILFIFLNFPIGSLLNACDRQRRNTLNMGIVLALSIILNLILIPRFQTLGASITVLITNILSFGLGLYFAREVISIRWKKMLPVFIKSAFSALVMGLCCYYLSAYINIFVLVGISIIIYFTILFVLKAFTRDDIRSIVSSFGRK